MQTRISNWVGRFKNVRVLVAGSLLFSLLLTSCSLFIVRVPSLNDPLPVSQQANYILTLPANYFISYDRFVKFQIPSCEGVCTNEVGFPLKIYEYPFEYGLIDELILENLAFNLGFYFILSLGVSLAIKRYRYRY